MITDPQGLGRISDPCLFCDHFDDNILRTDWTYTKPCWSEAGHTLKGSPCAMRLNFFLWLRGLMIFFSTSGACFLIRARANAPTCIRHHICRRSVIFSPNCRVSKSALSRLEIGIYIAGFIFGRLETACAR